MEQPHADVDAALHAAGIGLTGLWRDRSARSAQHLIHARGSSSFPPMPYICPQKTRFSRALRSSYRAISCGTTPMSRLTFIGSLIIEWPATSASPLRGGEQATEHGDRCGFARAIGTEVEAPRSEFPEDMPLKPGVEMELTGPEGQPMYARIERLEGENVVLNMNHPLAGKELHFEVKVIGLRDPTDEEMEHGHVQARIIIRFPVDLNPQVPNEIRMGQTPSEFLFVSSAIRTAISSMMKSGTPSSVRDCRRRSIGSLT